MTNGIRITISAQKILQDIKIDDSINIDGACQTVVRYNDKTFTVEAVGETLEKTTLKHLKPGSLVNLERSLTLNTRLGGHLVQGHVNGIGKVTRWYPRGENYFLEIELPQDLMRYCVREGSIAVNGISLTIAHLKERHIGINIIPHTVKHTTLFKTKLGDLVNIEVDVIARYVEKFLNSDKGSSTLSFDKLKEWGY